MTMTVGAARVSIYFETGGSLKEKRQVVRSLTKRVQNQFNAAIAEIEDLDDLRVATLGITCVSNSSAHADEMLTEVIGFLERNVLVGSLGEIETELIHL
jgi:uncharacterized protein YlxP (DUF503 family)